MSLKQKAFKGFAWNSLDSVLTRGISFAISIVVARVVSPDAYGLVGMLSVFIALSTLFVEGGFSKALVQRKNCSQLDFSTAFYFNVVISVFIYLTLYLLAPFIADFYQEPQLILLTRVMSLQFVFSAFMVVQKAKLLIDIDFKSQAKVNVLSVLISGTIGVYMAYNGFGVWALAGQSLSFNAITCLLLWLQARWRPSWNFSRKSFRDLFAYGSKILLAGVYTTLLTNIYTIVIGKRYQTAALGYYTRANTLAEISSGTLNTIITNVTFPLLSSVQEDRQRLLDVYRRILAMTSFIILPSMVLFAIVAKPFILLFLTEKWLPAVPLLQWLCLSRIFTPISSLNLNLLNAVGRSDLFLKTDLSKLPIIIIAMLITLPLGTKAVVIGSVIVNVLSYFINAYPSGKLFGYGALKQLQDCYRIMIATTVMACCSYTVMLCFDGAAMQLFIAITSALLSFFGASWLLKVKEMKELRNIFTRLRKR